MNPTSIYTKLAIPKLSQQPNRLGITRMTEDQVKKNYAEFDQNVTEVGTFKYQNEPNNRINKVENSQTGYEKHYS